MNDRVVATLAGRLDRITFEVFDTPFLLTQLPDRATHTAFNPSAAIQYRSASGWRVRASGGRAFVTPQAFHVAGQSEQAAWDAQRTVDLTRGNPDLQPENSITVDAGIGILRPATGLDAELVLFRTDVRDRITTSRSELTHVELTPDGDTIRSVTTFVNADDAAMRGIEARASYDLGARAGYAYSLRAFATATRMLRAVEIVGGEERMIQNVADMTINYGVEWDDLRRLSARLAGRYVGAREDTDWSDWTNPALVTYPAFMALDLATEVRVTGRYRIGLQVSNLTDENYYEKRGFPLPGRAFRLSASAGF
jgi:vitamin B12 transporter